MFAARVRNGFVPALRASVFRKFKALKFTNVRSLICQKVKRAVGDDRGRTLICFLKHCLWRASLVHICLQGVFSVSAIRALLFETTHLASYIKFLGDAKVAASEALVRPQIRDSCRQIQAFSPARNFTECER
jgi:hypothetical protein